MSTKTVKMLITVTYSASTKTFNKRTELFTRENGSKTTETIDNLIGLYRDQVHYHAASDCDTFERCYGPATWTASPKRKTSKGNWIQYVASEYLPAN